MAFSAWEVMNGAAVDTLWREFGRRTDLAHTNVLEPASVAHIARVSEVETQLSEKVLSVYRRAGILSGSVNQDRPSWRMNATRDQTWFTPKSHA